MKGMMNEKCVCPQCGYESDESDFKQNNDTAMKKSKGPSLEIFIGKKSEEDMD